MYRTGDLYLTAALQESGFPLVNAVKDGTRSTFEFVETAELQAAIGDYFAGRMMLPANSYAERIRSAKSMAVNAPSELSR